MNLLKCDSVTSPFKRYPPIKPFQINGNVIDQSSIDAAIRSKEPPRRHILIFCSRSVHPRENQALKQKGCTIQQYISENIYLCGYESNSFHQLTSIRFVSWAINYPRYVVLEPKLKCLSQNSQNTRSVNIILHEDTTQQEFQQFIDKLSSDKAIKGDVRKGNRKVQVVIHDKYLDRVASKEEVFIIRETPKFILYNDKARNILQARNAIINGTSFEGANQVIAVADSGFDKGRTDDVHPAFRNRVRELHATHGRNPPDDPTGHGTHVCGSVLGSGVSALLGTGPHLIEGIAPRASLVVQCLLNQQREFIEPFDLYSLFRETYYDDGAKIHTNSWGIEPTDEQKPYDEYSKDVDQFVWQQNDQVVLFAAGNSGIDSKGNGQVSQPTIGSAAASKNCITVGASESERPEIKVTYPEVWGLSRFPTDPIRDDPIADCANGMAAFSSRGPTREGRIKPDLVAPGTCVLSSRSRAMIDLPDWIKSLPASISRHTYDKLWIVDNGTSMATPLVAGCAAVIREVLLSQGVERPQAALIKALLINGADPLQGQYRPSETGPAPNVNSGFGRVNLKNSVNNANIVASQKAGCGQGDPLEDLQVHTFKLRCRRPLEENATFKITLVWSDPPDRELINHLDLIVKCGPQKRQSINTRNNVQQILWTNIPSGEVKIVIRASCIRENFPQPYAYAWHIM
jgi:subtilisin family serine protease